MEDRSTTSRAVIVCGHVARGAAILHAVRDEPLEERDSGWQFLCGAENEDSRDGKVWTVVQVLRKVPEFLPHIEAPYGTTVSRDHAHAPWRILTDR